MCRRNNNRLCFLWLILFSVNEKFCFILSIPLQRTFHYDSRYWTNKETVTTDGGKTGFDLQETKLPSYWNTSFSKICLGMRINKQSRFIVIKRTASSLHSLIADGKYRNTSLGRDTWKSLIGSEASMQFNCNREGFNAKSDKQHYPGRDQAKARIGILGNNENDCGQCDSRIGFGTGGVHDDSNTCGNEANIDPLDNGHKHIKAMGYILVQWKATDLGWLWLHQTIKPEFLTKRY